MKAFCAQLSKQLEHRYSANEQRVIARCLLERIVGLDASAFYLGKDRQFSSEQTTALQQALEALSRGEPLQYVVGCCEFFGRDFLVEPPVLIPRPETEELVQWLVDEQTPLRKRYLDVGTGSGCIAVSLAATLGVSVEAWDILPAALRLTQLNAAKHQVKVDSRRQDLFQAIASNECADQFDVVVSNPPYVCQSEAAEMSDTVLDYESPLALFVPDDDALKYYRALACLGHKVLTSHGAIYVEINAAFGPECLDLFRSEGYTKVELRNDLSGRNRFLRAVLS